MKLTLLGTGTPTPSLNRTSASYLLEAGDDVILFDCGPGSYVRLMQAGKMPTDITHVVFSHFHYDHCADFAAIALTHWDHSAGLRGPFRVYGPQHVHRFVDSLLGADGAFGPDIEARCKHEGSVAYYRTRGGTQPREAVAPVVTELSSGDRIEESGWSLSCVAVPHVQPYLVSLGLRLDYDGTSFCYSGDASRSEPFIRLINDCDILVHMCHRISGTELTPAAKTSSSGHMEVANIAADANVRSCVFSHISAQMDVPGVAERLLGEIAAVYSGNAIWAKDLMELDFAAPRPQPLI